MTHPRFLYFKFWIFFLSLPLSSKEDVNVFGVLCIVWLSELANELLQDSAQLFKLFVLGAFRGGIMGKKGKEANILAKKKEQ